MSSDPLRAQMKPRFLSRFVSPFIPKGRIKRPVTNSEDNVDKRDCLRVQCPTAQTALAPISISERIAVIEIDEQRTSESISTDDNEPGPIKALGDSERTRARYVFALELLRSCFTEVSTREGYSFIALDEFGETNQLIPDLREKIDQLLSARQSLPKDHNILRRIFAALTPFSKSLLSVGVQSQPVPLPSYDCPNVL